MHTLSAIYINDYNLQNGCPDINGVVNKTVTGSCHWHDDWGAATHGSVFLNVILY